MNTHKSDSKSKVLHNLKHNSGKGAPHKSAAAKKIAMHSRKTGGTGKFQTMYNKAMKG